jgi:hypothetical protein
MFENDTSLKYHSVFVKYNPSSQYTKWNKISEKAQNILLTFLTKMITVII